MRVLCANLVSVCPRLGLQKPKSVKKRAIAPRIQNESQPAVSTIDDAAEIASDVDLRTPVDVRMDVGAAGGAAAVDHVSPDVPMSTGTPEPIVEAAADSNTSSNN